MHIFKLDHEEMNPKEHMEMENVQCFGSFLWMPSPSKNSCEEFILRVDLKKVPPFVAQSPSILHTRYIIESENS